MATYQKADKECVELTHKVMRQFERHEPLVSAAVSIQVLFAYPNYDEKDNPVGNVIMHHGMPALGLAKIVNLKDRVKGLSDAEILVDYEWWKDHGDEERSALMDHQLYHFAVQKNKHGVVKKDDHDRPKLRMRKHDYQFGWFTCIAAAHGMHSQEHKQAQVILEENGQYYFPALLSPVRADVGEQAARVVRSSK